MKMVHTEDGSMEERRSENRKFLTYFSRVIDRDTGIMLGYLVDLTTGGALLIGNVSLKPNSVLQLRLDLPEDFSPQEKLEISSARRVEPAGHRPRVLPHRPPAD